MEYLQRYSSFSVRNGTAEISLPFAKLSSFQSLISRKQLREIKLQMVSAISFGWFAYLEKPLPLFNGRPSRFILTNGKHPIATIKLLYNPRVNTHSLAHSLARSLAHSLTQSYLQSLRYPRPLDKNNEGSGNGIGRLSVTARNTSHVCVRKPGTGHPRRPRSYLPG